MSESRSYRVAGTGYIGRGEPGELLDESLCLVAQLS